MGIAEIAARGRKGWKAPGAPVTGERRRKLIAAGAAVAVVGVVIALFVLLRPGDGAPEGMVQSHRGELVELSELWRDQRVVVVFFSGFQASRKQLGELDARLREFDAKVVGVSFGASHRARRIHQEMGLHFDLFVDPTYAVIGRWGVPFVQNDVTAPAAFVVEPGGEISYRKVGALPPFEELAAATKR